MTEHYQELELSLQQKEDNKLFDNYLQIKAAASKVLNHHHIPWYTDHGVGHSRRVIERLAAIESLLSEAERLSKAELFTLLSAAYLHDIGMCYLKIDGRSYPYTEKDYEEVRVRHPEWSAKFIEENADYRQPKKAFPLEIPSQYYDAIKNVCLAHVSDYFLETLPKLDKETISTGVKFRGPLVAALLLMGDELDLDSERAEKLFGSHAELGPPYPPESLLHIYRHHYIRRVEVRREEGYGQICLEVQFPPNSHNFANGILFGVARKLRKQCRLTGEIFAQNGLIWSDMIKVHLREESTGRRSLPDTALPVLQEVTAAQEIVNREDLLGRLKALARGDFGDSQAILIQGAKESDLQTLGDWFWALCELYKEKVPYERLDFDLIDPSHIVLIGDRIANLRKGPNKGICILQNLHKADEPVKRWLAGEPLAKLLFHEKAPPVALVAFAQRQIPGAKKNFAVEPLNRFTRLQLEEHFKKKIGCSEARAQGMLAGLDMDNATPLFITEKMKEMEKDLVVNVNDCN